MGRGVGVMYGENWVLMVVVVVVVVVVESSRLLYLVDPTGVSRSGRVER